MCKLCLNYIFFIVDERIYNCEIVFFVTLLQIKLTNLP